MSWPNGESEEGSRATTVPGLAQGTVVNGIYRLVRLLGMGGMGEVWEARHERTKGRVALKLLLPEMGRHPDVLHRFQREVEITSALNHPNIVRVSDADKLPDGRPFLVMEFLEGHDLSAVTGHPMPQAEAIEIIEQVALGLHAAHGQSILHRDLKPANIFLVPLPGTTRFVAKILDFGISKAMDGLSKLTQTRSVIGTPYYMAPEQATGGTASMDARADQFSLAAIAYELVTGRMAFDGDGMLNVIYKVVHEAPPTFATLGLNVSPAVEGVIGRGLSKTAPDRFASVLEFSDALKRAGGNALAWQTQPQTTPPFTGETRIIPTPPMTTTLRASVGQLEAVSSEEHGSDSPGTRPGRRRVVVAASVCAALAAALVVGAALRGRPRTTIDLSTAASIEVSGPGQVAAQQQTARVLPVAPPVPAVAPGAAFAPSSTVRAATDEGPPAIEHDVLPANPPVAGAVERPVPRSIAPVPPSPRKKKSVAVVVPASKPSPKKSATHPGPLNDDL